MAQPVPPTTTATTISAAATACQSYLSNNMEHRLKLLGPTDRQLMLSFLVDLAKLCGAVNALGAAPSAGDKSAAVTLQGACSLAAAALGGQV